MSDMQGDITAEVNDGLQRYEVRLVDSEVYFDSHPLASLEEPYVTMAQMCLSNPGAELPIGEVMRHAGARNRNAALILSKTLEVSDRISNQQLGNVSLVLPIYEGDPSFTSTGKLAVAGLKAIKFNDSMEGMSQNTTVHSTTNTLRSMPPDLVARPKAIGDKPRTSRFIAAELIARPAGIGYADLLKIFRQSLKPEDAKNDALVRKRLADVLKIIDATHDTHGLFSSHDSNTGETVVFARRRKPIKSISARYYQHGSNSADHI